MFWLIKQVFIELLSISGSLATRWASLSNELCMNRPIFIDLNPVELISYPFMISLGKCNGSCNTVDDVFIKICVFSKYKKDVNVKVFNIITSTPWRISSVNVTKSAVFYGLRSEECIKLKHW